MADSQRVVDLRCLVTQLGAKRSCGASSRDWPSATVGRDPNWPLHGSNFGSLAWLANGLASRFWTPCGRLLWRSIVDVGGCGHQRGIFHCNISTCGRRRNSSSGAKCTAANPSPDSVCKKSSPAPPRRRARRRRRKKSLIRSSRRRFNASAIRRSNRPYYPVSKSPPADGQPLTSETTAEQGGTGQPATRPKSKPDGSDKPQPEAEGRSR